MGRWETAVLHQEQVGRPVRESTGLLAVLGADRVVAEGEHVVRVDGDGHPKWRHGYGSRPRAGHVSGDRLLLLTDSFDYHAWGHLGPALLLDPVDGRVVAELRGERAAPLGGGRFVLGMEGYDVFDTWLHERDGSRSATWRSYGHHVPDPDGTIRVVECDRRTPTSSRVVRLFQDGRIERGPRLSGSQVPPPVVLADGTLVVLDTGVLRAVGRDLDGWTLAELLHVPPGETWRFRRELALDGARLTVTVEERHAGEPAGSTWLRWTLSVSKRR